MLTFKRSLAVFVLAFLCLNVGGVLCLTYCAGISHARAASTADTGLSDHCRHAKKEAKEKDQDLRANVRSFSCCLLPIAFFAAPLEKRTSFSAVAIEAASVMDVPFAPLVRLTSYTPPPFIYRPPPLDHSVDRILHGVIRI